MALKISKREAERPNDRRNFPEGSWVVEIEEVRTRDPQQFMYEVSANAKEGSKPRILANGQLVTVQLGKAEAIDDAQEDPGNQKLFVEMVIADSDYRLDTLTEGAETGWGIKRSAATYANLALALGQAFEEDGGIVPADGFLDALLNGEFNGHKVIAEVEHSSWTSKATGKSGVNVNTTLAPAA